MRRVAAVLALIGICLTLLLAATAFLLASLFLLLATMLPPWLAAVSTSFAIVLVLVLVLAAASRTQQRDGAPMNQQQRASAMVRQHPLGAAGAALAAGALMSSSEQTRDLLFRSVASYIKVTRL